MLAPRLVTPPVQAPVSLEEFKAQTRVDGADEDALLSAYIAAATDRLDGWRGMLGRALLTQTWAVDMPGFAADAIRIPLGPVQSVSSVKYYSGGVQQTVTASNYRLHEDACGHYLRLIDGATWPASDTREDAVTVTWVAGFGDNPADVPDLIRYAITLIAAHFNEAREDTSERPLSETPHSANMLLSGLRRYQINP